MNASSFNANCIRKAEWSCSKIHNSYFKTATANRPGYREYNFKQTRAKIFCFSFAVYSWCNDKTSGVFECAKLVLFYSLGLISNTHNDCLAHLSRAPSGASRLPPPANMTQAQIESEVVFMTRSWPPVEPFAVYLLPRWFTHEMGSRLRYNLYVKFTRGSWFILMITLF